MLQTLLIGTGLLQKGSAISEEERRKIDMEMDDLMSCPLVDLERIVYKEAFPGTDEFGAVLVKNPERPK